MTTLPYRPAIDGLRAVAVLAVFIFHLNRAWLPGGFVGVDIFFVLSGYLITSLLLKEYQQSNFNLWKFYQRRIARLFPAFFTVALATLTGAWFIYTAQDLASFTTHLIAATLGVANMSALWQGNYFTAAPDSTPFLHCWSLSIEEQFYLLFPAGFLWIYLKAKRWITVILATLGAVSLSSCSVVTHINPEYAFYLLPTRAWELVAGCLLAISPSPARTASGNLWQASSLFGLALILLSFFVIHEGSGFPGYIALLPVLATVLFLGPNGNSPGLAGQLLSWSPLVLIGRMSYSLYLWHWPIFSFVDYKLYLADPLVRLGLKIGLSLVATVACYYLVEKPGRAFLNQPGKLRLSFGLLGGAVALVVLLGMDLGRTSYLSAEARDVPQGGLAFNPTGKRGSIVLMGDSHASMYGKTLKEVADQLDFKLNVISVVASRPLPGVDEPDPQLWNDSLAFVKRQKPDFLFLICNWRLQMPDGKDRLGPAIQALKPYVHSIVLLTQPPTIPDRVTREAMRAGLLPPFFEYQAYRTRRQEMNTLVGSYQGKDVVVIDANHYFEAPDNTIILWDKAGHELYQDHTHLSQYGAEKLKPDIISVLSQAPPNE